MSLKRLMCLLIIVCAAVGLVALPEAAVSAQPVVVSQVVTQVENDVHWVEEHDGPILEIMNLDLRYLSPLPGEYYIPGASFQMDGGTVRFVVKLAYSDLQYYNWRLHYDENDFFTWFVPGHEYIQFIAISETWQSCGGYFDSPWSTIDAQVYHIAPKKYNLRDHWGNLDIQGCGRDYPSSVSVTSGGSPYTLLNIDVTFEVPPAPEKEEGVFRHSMWGPWCCDLVPVVTCGIDMHMARGRAKLKDSFIWIYDMQVYINGVPSDEFGLGSDEGKFGYSWGNLNYTPSGNIRYSPLFTLGNDSDGCTLIGNEYKYAPWERYPELYDGSDFFADLSVDVSAPEALTVNSDGDGYEPSPVTVTAYIENAGNRFATNAQAEIVLPKGMSLLEDAEATVSLGNMAPGKKQEVSWNVHVENQLALREFTYNIIVTAGGIEAKVLDVNLTVPSVSTKTGLFKYPGVGRDHSATYYYDDRYFIPSAYLYNPQLATMSLCFQLSAWGSEDWGNLYTYKMVNARDLLKELEFEGFVSNYTDFSGHGVVGKPTRDSIGAVAAHKNVYVEGTDYTYGRDYTLIALAIRGGGYESEWASNLTMGEFGQHQGFREARDQIIAFLQDYISNNEITGDIKLWLTGYSRAGAVANLVAGAINEGRVPLPGCSLAPADLYAYTFATPAGALEQRYNDSIFDNIFNIISPNDPVTKVAPEAWSFTRYGDDRIIPTRENQADEYDANLDNMKTKFYALEGVASYVIDDFSMKRIQIEPSINWGLLPLKPSVSIEDDIKNIQSQNIFLNNYITTLSRDFLISRSNYVAEYQYAIRDMCGLFFGSSKVQTEKLFEVAIAKFSSNWGGILWELLRPFGGLDAAYGKVAEYLRESLDEAGITSYTENEFDNAVTSLVDLLIRVALNDPNLTTTMVLNIKGIGQAHRPEIYLAWLQSMDPNYTPGAAVVFTSGQYRVVRINCPVDVNVYNRDNVLVASIIADVPQKVSSIVAAVNEDGEKLVFLPASDDYTVELIATGDGMMTYSINEYHPSAGGMNRLVNYYDIPIENGQMFTSDIPSYSAADLENTSTEASSTLYTLSTMVDIIIAPSDELSGEEATAAYFYIDVRADDPTKGIVFGPGSRQLGHFAMVTAAPYEDVEFLGWYENGIDLVSTDLEYSFRVMHDVDLVARFASTVSGSYTITFNSAGGNYVAPQEALHGGLVSRPADPVRWGYTFAGWYYVYEDNDFAFNFNEMRASSNFTLTAKWTPVKYTISFNSAGGSYVAPQEALHGGLVPRPADPVRTGYTFIGWYYIYENNDFAFNFNEMRAASDFTLTAKWK